MLEPNKNEWQKIGGREVCQLPLTNYGGRHELYIKLKGVTYGKLLNLSPWQILEDATINNRNNPMSL